ncbi:MAG: penicillin-binding protein 1C [Caldilineaceae bacterium]|nr:penicillin-binding protein 1C [Caldilineaceae bacterium]
MTRRRFCPKPICITLLVLGGLFLLSAVIVYAWLLADLPPVSALEQRLVRPSTRILDRNGRLLYEVIDPDMGKQIDLTLDAIPLACRQATIATEDSRFYLHPGIDPVAILRAAIQNRRSGGIVSGASTITQQLARMLLLTPDERLEASYTRKLREAWLAWRLETRYTKNELLVLYLNQSYYGSFAFGLEAAAQTFFAKPAAQLSRGECALLAGLLQNPGVYNPLADPEAAMARRQTVIRLMQEKGYLDAEEAALVEREALRYRARLFPIRAPHFVMYVQDQLTQMLGTDAIRRGGLTITTTLDLDLQRAAEEAVRRRLAQLNCEPPAVCADGVNPNRRIDNAAAVTLDSRTGDILAMVGSPDYFDAAIQGNVNAALSLRQPGSAIKPFTYAAALDPAWSAQAGVAPLTPASIIADLPATFYAPNAHGEPEAYTPLNYDRAFHGPVSVRTALASSYNIPAVKTLERVGVDTLRTLAARAGITTFTERYGLALTLGGGEVRLLELTAAYGTLDDGIRLEPRSVLAVEGGGLGDWEMGRLGGERVIDAETAYLITDILSDPAARRPAFGQGSVLELPFPAAVKTGTTTDWRDNWTVGYSTERVIGVWVGNADNAPMVGVSGLDGAGPIWHDMMLAAHTDDSPPFARPADIVEVEICGPSGMLPGDACTQLRQERFRAGTEPALPDTQFRRVTLDRRTGLPAAPDTPAEETRTQVVWVLPPAYHDWMISHNLPVLDATAPILGGATSSLNREPGPAEPLVLTGPDDMAVYQIHPGLPASSQRIAVQGYANSGPWAALRLVVDGATLIEMQDTATIQAWWTLTPGEHRFRLEGETKADGATVRSPTAAITVRPVEEFAASQQ